MRLLVKQRSYSVSRIKATVHPTAIVSREAWLDEGVEVGPYSIIGPQVKVGRDTKISSHVHIEGDTEIGERCRIFPGAVLGTPSQTKKSEHVRSRLLIGNDNILREYVNINPGMTNGSKTVIGDRNFLMANVHVAHDCVLGSDIVISNYTGLSGHVQVEDGAVLGGLAGVHQFVRIGRLAMLGGLSKAVMDVAPFSIYEGQRAKFCGVNTVGLKRAGYTSKRISDIKNVLKTLFADHSSFSKTVPRVQSRFRDNPDVQALISFIRQSKRGVGRAE